MKLKQYLARCQQIEPEPEVPLVSEQLLASVIEEACDSDGRLLATKMCSAALETHLWLLHDQDFEPPDDDPVFFEGELAVLATKDPDEMRAVLRFKAAFPRCRVVQ